MKKGRGGKEKKGRPEGIGMIEEGGGLARRREDGDCQQRRKNHATTQRGKSGTKSEKSILLKNWDPGELRESEERSQGSRAARAENQRGTSDRTYVATRCLQLAVIRLPADSPAWRRRKSRDTRTAPARVTPVIRNYEKYYGYAAHSAIILSSFPIYLSTSLLWLLQSSSDFSASSQYFFSSSFQASIML